MKVGSSQLMLSLCDFGDPQALQIDIFVFNWNE